ncbi:hypothetical protein GLOIN_2v1783661 [Rhizophagus clarus]|uniref:RNase H type-1 domain-containing protein n=1 Tax=Rhizophagus clarus TaxID=94130 RepID=A0A8H3QTG7_9GLOM|nr:hypothetical protein GLOIN_2v1783661 [Rhizophagus clarus]
MLILIIAYIAHLADKCDHSLPHKWYLDIKANTTISDSHDRLYDRYVYSPSTTPVIDLVPGATTTQKNRHWLITLDENDISDCLSSPDDVIHLHPYPGCDAHVLFPAANKYSAVTPSCTFKISLLKSLILSTNCEHIQQSTTEVISSYSWADLCDMMVSYYRRNISPDFSSPSSIVDDSQAAIDDLHLCAFSAYTNSRLYYKTTNFELWAAIECSIHTKRLTIYPVKVKGHDGNYWNEFANSLATSAHHSDNAILLPVADYTSAHNVCLIYDDVVCESNPRQLLKLYYQATFMKDLLSLKRFQFTFCLCNRNDYVID